MRRLFGHFFKDQQTWTLWKSYLSGLFGLEMAPERLALFLKHTGRSKPPVGEFDKILSRLPAAAAANPPSWR